MLILRLLLWRRPINLSIGPMLGPVMGGYLAEAEGWRWVFWVIAIAVRQVPFLPSNDYCSLKMETN